MSPPLTKFRYLLLVVLLITGRKSGDPHTLILIVCRVSLRSVHLSLIPGLDYSPQGSSAASEPRHYSRRFLFTLSPDRVGAGGDDAATKLKVTTATLILPPLEPHRVGDRLHCSPLVLRLPFPLSGETFLFGDLRTIG